jgi:hypothetical protein
VEKYSTTKDIVSNEASSIKIVKDFFSNLSGNLAYIKTNFGSISTTISHLEAVGAEMHGTLVLVKSTECKVGHACGKVGASLKFKLHNVLGRNYGYAAALCKISDILSGNGV